MEIINFVTTSSATANGVDKNSAKAVVMNGGDYANSVSVVFFVTGAAQFENGTNSITVTSNVLGEVAIQFVDTVAENVTVLCSLKDDSSVSVSGISSFSQSSGDVDNIYMILTADDAKADGEDTDVAELQTLNGNIPVPNVTVGLTVNHGATLINGQSTGQVVTNSHGRASVSFMNSQPGSVTLTAYLDDNLSINNKINANFESAEPNVSLVLSIENDGAYANGQALNQVMAVVTDADSGQPLTDEEVIFTITSGNALFTNDTKALTVTTTADGVAYAALKDNTVETVTVTAKAGGRAQSVSPHFSQNLPSLVISRVYNKNKSFAANGPTTAWVNAEFNIEANGGSGHYTWSVQQGEGSLTIIPSSEHIATLSFNASQGRGQYIVRVTDEETNLYLDYTFSINIYFYEYGHWEHGQNVPSYPSDSQLTALYDEWGDMVVYSGWLTQDNSPFYWTSKVDYNHTYAINLRTGSIERFGTGNYYGRSRVE